MNQDKTPEVNSETLLSILEKFKTAKLEPATPPRVNPVTRKITKAEFTSMVDSFLQGVEKPMFSPIVKEITEPQYKPDITNSKYFGSPWLYKKEGWPLIGGLPAVFVMQLNISTLPEPMKSKLGNTGLLQFFYQADTTANCDYIDASLVRIVDISKPGKTLPQPKVDDYLIPTEKLITSWQEYTDYPNWENLQDIEGYQYLEDLAQANNYILDDYIPRVYGGDKLGGWPLWTQGAGSLEGYVYQIDMQVYEQNEQRCVRAYAPALFAGSGTGHIFIEGNEGEFYWDCD